MFCCRSHGDIGLLLEYSRGCQGICNHPPLLWIVNNIVTFKLCSQKFKKKSKDFAQNQNGWFFNDSSKIVKKFSQMQNLGQLGPENCRAYVFFAWCVCVFFVCVCVCVCFLFFVCFPLRFFFFLFFPFSFFLFFLLLIAWSKGPLIVSMKISPCTEKGTS